MGVGTASSGDQQQEEVSGSASVSPEPQQPQQQQPAQSMDLLADIFGGGASSGSSPVPPATSSPPSSLNKNNALMDLLGGGDVQPQQSSTPPPSNSSPDPLASLGLSMGGAGTSSPSSAQRSISPAFSSGSPAMANSSPKLPTTQSTSSSSSSTTNGYQAYGKNGFVINLVPAKDRNNAAIINIQVLFHNNTEGNISSLQFQAAVPRSQKLQMAPASSSTVQPGGTEKQLMRINNPQQVKQCFMIIHLWIKKKKLMNVLFFFRLLLNYDYVFLMYCQVDKK